MSDTEKWERAVVVGVRTFALAIVPIVLLFSWIMLSAGYQGDVVEGLLILIPIGFVVSVPVAFVNAFIACWISKWIGISVQLVARLLAVLGDFGLVAVYLNFFLLFV